MSRAKFIFCVGFLLAVLAGCVDRKSITSEQGENAFTTENEKWGISKSQNWVEEKGLKNAESVIFDERNGVFYVSNGEKYEEGNSGFISKISQNGELLELKWIANLNRPTGMSIVDSILYVADVSSLKAINTTTAKILSEYDEPIKNSGLNDVAVNSAGDVFVSASFIHSVFKLEDDKLVLWSKDEDRLKWANGLEVFDNELIVAGLNLCKINFETKEISSIPCEPWLKDFDGVANDINGGFFLSTVDNSGFYHLDRKGKATTLSQDSIYYGDLHYERDDNTVIIPRGNKTEKSYFLTVFKLEKQKIDSDY